MAYEYRETMDGINADQLAGFFAGWPEAPGPDALCRILAASDHKVLALATPSGEVAGFTYAISDHVIAAYVPLLEVRRPHRSRGVGSALVSRLLSQLRHLYMIDACCDDDVAPFYEAHGFSRVSGMIFRNREALRRSD